MGEEVQKTLASGFFLTDIADIVRKIVSGNPVMGDIRPEGACWL